jgi:hypothetical protein
MRAATAEGASPPARALGRAIAWAVLDRASREHDRELAERTARQGVPPGGFEAATAAAADPEDRVRLHARWRRAEDDLAMTREARLAARETAARDMGATGLVVLSAGLEPSAPAALAREVERVAIAPLDDRVREVALERRTAPAVPLAPAVHPADAPVFATLADVRQLRRADPAGIVRRWGGRWHVDPDAGHLALAVSNEVGWPEGGWLPAGVPFLRTGRIDGAAGATRALGLLGGAARLAFLDRARGAAAHWTDPAFPRAAEVLFRRLALDPGFRAESGLGRGDDPALDRALRHEEALAPRLAWAYLSLEVEGRGSRESIEVLERALGRPVIPGLGWGADDGAAASAAVRGTILGLLYEETLMTRHGRAWYSLAAAVRSLREWWEAEPDRDAAAMATDLGDYRMEATPILDRCRP